MLFFLLLGIIEDVRDECERYGRVEGLEIPRPLGAMSVPGVGKVRTEDSVGVIEC